MVRPCSGPVSKGNGLKTAIQYTTIHRLCLNEAAAATNPNHALTMTYPA